MLELGAVDPDRSPRRALAEARALLAPSPPRAAPVAPLLASALLLAVAALGFAAAMILA